MIIIIGSQKGGVGKSTIAINVCAWLAQKGKDVVLVDADEQRTAARWADDRAEAAELPVVNSVQKTGDIRNTLKDLKNRYDFVVVDVAGKDSKELRSGMIVADMVLVPFRPSQMDLDTIAHLNEMVDEVKDLNPKLQVLATLNMAPTNPSVTEAQDAKTFLNEFPAFTMLESIVRERKIYRDVVPFGQGVVDTKHDKANEEINNLMNEVMSYAI